MASSQLQKDKANAMRRFQRKRNLETIFHLFNLCATILLFSHSSLFPITLQTLTHLYHVLVPISRNSFYAFLLLNTIIVFLFALYNKHNNNNNLGASASKDVYHEILNHNQSRLIVTPPQEQSRTVDSSDKKVTTICHSEVGESPVLEETVTTTEGEKKRYRRVQSESYERRMVVAPPRGELETELKRPLQRQLRCVEQLSEDEFNRAVEEFIAMHKRMQWEEQIGSHKTGYLAACTL